MSPFWGVVDVQSVQVVAALVSATRGGVAGHAAPAQGMHRSAVGNMDGRERSTHMCFSRSH